MKILTVNESFVKAAHAEACDKWKKKIESEFPNLFPKKLVDRIKTWDDVLDISGKSENEVLPYRNPKTKQEKSLNALAKIQLISEVLNEGWEPDFNNSNEYKYYPYFQKISGGWVFVLCLGDYGIAIAGAGMYFKSSELAMFAGERFIDIYKDFLPN